LDLNYISLLPQTFDYYRSGATDEQTLQDNVDAFKKIRIRPRVLTGVEKVDLSVSVLGHRVSSPILVAPTAMQRMAHDEGERATAKGWVLSCHDCFCVCVLNDFLLLQLVKRLALSCV